MFTLAGIVQKIVEITQGVFVPVIVGLALLYFVAGLLMYMRAGGSEDKIGQGIKYMTRGIIAMTVIVTFWGIVNIFAGIFGESASIIQFNEIRSPF